MDINMTKEKNQEKPKLIAVIPKGDVNQFSVMHAESFDRLFDNGTIGSDGTFVPDQVMIERMQKNIGIAMEKLVEYQEELLNAHKVLSTIVPHENYDELAKKIQSNRLKLK